MNLNDSPLDQQIQMSVNNMYKRKDLYYYLFALFHTYKNNLTKCGAKPRNF